MSICCAGVSILLSVIPYSESVPPGQSVPAILGQIAAGYESLDSAYVEFDVYVEVDGANRLWLSEQEAISDKCHYIRIVHWYNQWLYQFDSPEYDPILNSRLWSDTGIVSIYETVRQAYTSKPIRTYLPTPSIKRYFGHVGLLTPERVLEPHVGIPGSDIDVSGYSVRDFYLCSAIENPGEWNLIQCDEDSKRAVIRRAVHDSVDTITVDVGMCCAIINRKIVHKPSGASYTITGSDFQEFSPVFWLPRKIVVNDSGRQKRTFQVTKLTTKIPPEVLNPDISKPGFRVRNEDDGTEYIVPGGEDLLDFTIERMRLAMPPQQSRASIWSAWIVALVIQALVFFILRRQKGYREA